MSCFSRPVVRYYLVKRRCLDLSLPNRARPVSRKMKTGQFRIGFLEIVTQFIVPSDNAYEMIRKALQTLLLLFGRLACGEQ